MMSKQNIVRILLILFIVIISSSILIGNPRLVPGEETTSSSFDARSEEAPPTDNITVVTGQGIIAYDSNGSILYENGTYEYYWDVDPEPEQRTVLYAATERVDEQTQCVPIEFGEHCIRHVIERLNLETGETERIFSHVTPKKRSSEWHDVDRINENHLLIAGMYSDRVFIVDTSTGLINWQWNVQNNYSLDTGGQYPENWVHLNDVEYIHNGTVMVSLRNQDQVVFVDTDRGLIQNMTLGEENEYSILYEQHNPDYIPTSKGGPAVLISDSENNRVVEYQRTDGEWTQTWTWKDQVLTWPRDADRLPNGNTLITDSHGDRVLEVNEQGEIVWEIKVSYPYEAERLETSPESTGGQSAIAADLESRGQNTATQVSRSTSSITDLLPNKIANGIRSIVPWWMTIRTVAMLIILVVTSTFWITLEFYWSTYKLRSPIRRGQS